MREGSRVGPAGVLALLGTAVVPLPLQRHPLTLQGDLFLEAFPSSLRCWDRLWIPRAIYQHLGVVVQHDDLRRASSDSAAVSWHIFRQVTQALGVPAYSL